MISLSRPKYSTFLQISCKIKGLLDECGKIVIDPKCVGNLMKTKFVNTAHNFLKERKDVVDVKNNEYLSDPVKNDCL